MQARVGKNKNGKCWDSCPVSLLLPPRVGWSTGDSGLDLGEAPLSYGYGCTGKAVVNNQYIEYGEPYGDGDVITCLLVGVYIITNLNNYFSP